MSKPANLFFYYKTGDDFDRHLTVANGNPIQGLRNWADHLESASAGLRELANRIEHIDDLAAEGDTHYAAIYGIPEPLLGQLEEDGLIFTYDDDSFEDEDDFEFTSEVENEQ